MPEKKIICKICGYETKNSLQSHLRCEHNIRNKEYLQKYPNAIIYSKAYGDRLRYTNAHRNSSYKKKISKKIKENWKDPEKRKKYCKNLLYAQNTEKAKFNHKKGADKYFRNRTEEQRKKSVNAIKKSWEDPIKRNNRLKALRISHAKEETKKKHSEAMRNFLKHLSPKERLERRKRLKEVWALPENRKKILELSKLGLIAARRALREGALKGKFPIRSYLNIKMEKALEKAHLYPEAEFLIDPYMVDFCFPDLKLVIEADGNWWHGNPDIYKELHPAQKRTIQKDKYKCAFLKNNSYTVLRFWEEDINKDIDECINKIKEKIYELRR